VPGPEERRNRSPWERDKPVSKLPRAGRPVAPAPRRRWPVRLSVVLAILAGVGLLIGWLALETPGSMESSDDQIGLVRHLAWLLVLLPAVALVGRYRARAAIRDAALWFGVLGLLVVGYAYRGELARIAGRVGAELVPHRGTVADGGGTIAFRAARDGHFHVEAAVDGVPVRFMVDTGASNVVLSPADARRLGFDLAKLSFHQVFHTANGMVRGAPVTFAEVRIGPIALRDVRASVNGADMSRSLLGMSFLNRLGGYTVENGTLTLRQ
jgi:aspartyl protease family protein